jgi:copper chaperone CopZ
MGCVRRVTLAIKSVNGVRTVAFDATSETFEVTMVSSVVVDELAARVHEAGEMHDRELAPQNRHAWVLRAASAPDETTTKTR